VFCVVEFALFTFTFQSVEFGCCVIVGSLRDLVMNGNIESIRCFLAANPSTLASEKCPIDDKMTLVMLAARHGQLLFTT